MAGISEGPDAFFRIGPAELGGPEWFAVRRGDAQQRLDPHFHRPRFAALLKRLAACGGQPLSSITQLSGITRIPAAGGFGATFPYIEIANVGLGTGEYSVTETPTDAAPSRARQLVSAGDLLVSLTRPHRGAVVIVKGEDEGAIASTGFAVLRTREGLDRRFLEYALISPAGLEQMLMRSSGGAYPAITVDELLRILIPVLPCDRQRHISERMDAARAERRAKLAEAEAQAGLFGTFLLGKLGLALPSQSDRQVFGIKARALKGGFRWDPGYHHPRYAEIARAFAACPAAKVPLGEISPVIVGGATPSRGDANLYAEDGVRFLRIMNVRSNRIDLEDVKFIQEHVHRNELRRSQLAADDVLMTITGRVGTAAVVTAALLPANINQHIVRLRIAREGILPEYLAAYLNSPVGFALSNRGVTGGTRVALDYGAIRALQIPVPEVGEQKEIVAELNRHRDAAERLRREAEDGWQVAKIWFEAQLLGDPAV